MLDMNAIDAYEYLVDEDFTDALDSAWTNQCKPVSTQKSAGNNDLEIVAVTQLHRHIHRIRQNCDSLVKANATGNLRRCGSGADGEDVAVADQFGCDEADATFFRAALSFLFVIGRNVTKRLVKRRLNRYCAAMAAPQKTTLLK